MDNSTDSLKHLAIIEQALLSAQALGPDTETLGSHADMELELGVGKILETGIEAGDVLKELAKLPDLDFPSAVRVLPQYGCTGLALVHEYKMCGNHAPALAVWLKGKIASDRRLRAGLNPFPVAHNHPPEL